MKSILYLLKNLFEHLTTATLLENKGRLLLELKKYDQAEIQFRDVINGLK